MQTIVGTGDLFNELTTYNLKAVLGLACDLVWQL